MLKKNTRVGTMIIIFWWCHLLPIIKSSRCDLSLALYLMVFDSMIFFWLHHWTQKIKINWITIKKNIFSFRPHTTFRIKLKPTFFYASKNFPLIFFFYYCINRLKSNHTHGWIIYSKLNVWAQEAQLNQHIHSIWSFFFFSCDATGI